MKHSEAAIEAHGRYQSAVERLRRAEEERVLAFLAETRARDAYLNILAAEQGVDGCFTASSSV